MTVEELIHDLERIREEYGPHIEVAKRRVNVSDGSTQYEFVKSVCVNNANSKFQVVSL